MHWCSFVAVRTLTSIARVQQILFHNPCTAISRNIKVTLIIHSQGPQLTKGYWRDKGWDVYENATDVAQRPCDWRYALCKCCWKLWTYFNKPRPVNLQVKLTGCLHECTLHVCWKFIYRLSDIRLSLIMCLCKKCYLHVSLYFSPHVMFGSGRWDCFQFLEGSCYSSFQCLGYADHTLARPLNCPPSVTPRYYKRHFT